jgi:hypothetical protein
MTISSNLYASKIFSEHPISLYPLDDDASYLSLINNTQRLFGAGSWTASADNSASVSFNDSPTLPDLQSPFNSDIFSSFEITGVSANNTTATIFSQPLFELQDLNQELATFAISLYLYQSSVYVNWYEVGYVYFDEFIGGDKEVVTRIEANEGSEWINFNFSYLPSQYDENTVRLLIRANVEDGGSSSDYTFIANGICVGQWAENSFSQSLGAISSSTEFDFDGVVAAEYGFQENSGYYVVEENRLLAKNQGVPMVYGSDNVTVLYPSASSNPSVVLPGDGFLFESGRHNDYTVEFWLRINPDTKESRRIFGPIDDNNGIYVSDGVISLAIGNNFVSHPVSEWYRPMLLQIILKDNLASLIINGENVGSIPFDKNTVVLSDQNDWVGFYNYDDIFNMQIDCVVFYPYAVAVTVAKRRFVYGQGTISSQIVADYFDGTTAYINFSNADYTANKVYPDISNWQAGYRNNLNATRSSISSPNYSLPNIYIGGRDVNQLYADNKTVNELQEDELFFTFRPHESDGEFNPNGTNWTEPGYLFFNSLNFVDKLSSFYAIFSTKNVNDPLPLISIKNINSFDVFDIILEDYTIKYYFNNELLGSYVIDEYAYEYYDYYYEELPTLDEDFQFAVGLNFKKFSKSFGYAISNFFQSPNFLEMYVGGDTLNTFNGKIFRVGFTNSVNDEQISSKFFNNGIVKYDENEFLLEHMASYTLKPLIRFDRFFLDIGISAIWEEYFPLTTFASFIKDSRGRKIYDLDYLQINLGYPSITERVPETIENLGWTYQELYEEFNTPIQKSYEILDNPILSGYETYADLNTNTITRFFLNTDKSSIKAYLTFQLLSEGANEPLSSFPFTRDLIDCCFIDANAENTTEQRFRAYRTKFEFIDKVVVFPPTTINIKDVAMVVHFDIKQDGILSHPVKLREFEVASRALEQYSFNPIGTESGIDLYPYVKTGIYYDAKEKNPVLISKKRTPYLYLTQDSGIRLLGPLNAQKEHGIAVPINPTKSNDFAVGAIQLWTKYDGFSFPAVPYPVFEIQTLDKTIEFVIRSDSSAKRGIIFARNKKTKRLESGITFYQNGIRVKNPIVEYNEWSALGIAFDVPLSFNLYNGYINLFRAMTFNNISFYRPSGLGETLGILARSWLRVLTADDIVNFDWGYWYDENGTSEIKDWEDVYVIDETRSAALTPQNIYQSYVGTNRIVVDDDDSELVLDADTVSILSSATWSRFIGPAV